MIQLYFIAGASESGKTTIIKPLQKVLGNLFKVYDFDDIGVPEKADKKMEAGINRKIEEIAHHVERWARKINMKNRKKIDELSTLMNVGPATRRDLELLGIETIDQLKDQSAHDLYEKLQTLTRKKHDPCVWDVFSAIIHEAQTGEKMPWWHFTSLRKKREQ